MDVLPERSGDTDHVQSLVRGLAVIRTFSADHPARTLSEIAREAGLPRAAARRSLITLRHLGYVGESQGRFWLRAKVLDLGYGQLSGMSLKAIAEEQLETLSAEVGASTSMSTLDGTDIVYVTRVPAAQIMAASINLGTRFPAHATSMGRVLLSALTDEQLDSYLRSVRPQSFTRHTITDPQSLREAIIKARRQGWAFVDQELEEGLRAVAAPVRSRSGRVVASVNVSCHADQADLPLIRRSYLPPLLATVARIETELASHPDSEFGARLSS